MGPPNGYELLKDIDRRSNDDAFLRSIIPSFNTFLVDELEGDEIVGCWQARKLLGKDWPKGENGNYRIDKEPPPLKDPARQRFAIQVNDNPPDKALKKSRRTKSGTGGGSFTKSNATFAQIEANVYMDQSEGSGAADILREAFYQSMIPEHIFNRQFLHHVYISEKGEIWIKKSQGYADYLQNAAEKEAKGGNKGSGKGKK